MIQPILLILILIQTKFTWDSIKACFEAEAVTATWQQISVLGIELVVAAYIIITWDVKIYINF